MNQRKDVANMRSGKKKRGGTPPMKTLIQEDMHTYRYIINRFIMNNWQGKKKNRRRVRKLGRAVPSSGEAKPALPGKKLRWYYL
jgi:hypothetical protein